MSNCYPQLSSPPCVVFSIPIRMHQSNKPMLGLLVLAFVFLMEGAGATEFKVGGANGWGLSNDNSTPNFNQWAEKNRFQVGDSLLFVYSSDKDSVLQVTLDDYTKCNTASPIATFKDGNTQFKFSKSGAYYFISGNKDNCLKNEKMHVIVMAYRGSQTTMAPPPSPGSTESPPSPPPSGSTDTVPSPAPVGEESPSKPAPTPNRASTMFLSTIGSLGAFIGSYLLLVL